MFNLIYCFLLEFILPFLLLFPVWEPNEFASPPTPLGPFSFQERQVQLDKGADCCPLEITVVEPVGAAGPRPTMVWVNGSNVQSYYHQALIENLASFGYVVVVPETRPLTFLIDFEYHKRNADNAALALELAARGELGVEVDPRRIAVGGYSIGGPRASFVAAALPQGVQAMVFWAPSGTPFWLGLDAPSLWNQVSAPALYVLGELDPIAPPEGFPTELRDSMPNSPSVEYVISGGTHLFFQQVTGADSAEDPVTTLTRFEQQGIAILATRQYLDRVLARRR